MIKRDSSKRPFLLSRSTFPGHGRSTFAPLPTLADSLTVGAHWLGDNRSTWQSFVDCIQGVLQFQFFQVPMTGPDAGGFGPGKDAGEELLNRWMQLAAWFPFYRNHNSDGAHDQYPYLYDSVKEASIQVINARYALLPYWESLFKSAHQDGTPPLRPLFFEFPEGRLLDQNLQFMVGPSLLITPVVHKGHETVKGSFPSANGTQWRSWWTHELVSRDGDDMAELDAPLGHIPVHIRSGSVLLVYNEPKYTLKETREGSMGVVIHLNDNEEAEGVFHMDDGTSIDGESQRSWRGADEAGPSKEVEIRVSQGRIAVMVEGSLPNPSIEHRHFGQNAQYAKVAYRSHEREGKVRNDAVGGKDGHCVVQGDEHGSERRWRCYMGVNRYAKSDQRQMHGTMLRSWLAIAHPARRLVSHPTVQGATYIGVGNPCPRYWD